MTTRHHFGSIAVALVFTASVFTPRRAKASPDLFPPDNKLIKMDCTGGKCKTIPRKQLPSFIADLIKSEGLPFTPEVLGLFHLPAMKVACDRSDNQRIILHPRLNSFSTKAELEALVSRKGCVRLSYAFNGEQDMRIPTEIPACQRDRASCDRYVSGLETRLATANSCAADELYAPRTDKCVKGAESEFVANLQQAVAQKGAKYAKLRNAIADCENGRVTLDEGGNPVCQKIQSGAAGIVWLWQILALVLGVLAIWFYWRWRTLLSLRERVSQTMTKATEACNMLKVECVRLKADRKAALDMLGYDGSWTAAAVAADVTKKVHVAAGTPLARQATTTLWAAVAGLEFNARALARRVRTLAGRLGRVGVLLEVVFDKEADGVDEILPALGKLRAQLGIRGNGTGYSKTIPAAVSELVIAREAAENAVESLRAARQPVAAAPAPTVAESALTVQPSASATDNGHGNGARQRAVAAAFYEIQTCAARAGQPNRQRRILAALERLRREVPALIAV